MTGELKNLTIKTELQRQLLEGGRCAPWALAEDMETLGYVEIISSKYQRKNTDTLRLILTAEGVEAAGSPPCDGTGTCAVCEGQGEHLMTSPRYTECVACEGSGECPCTHDTTTHPEPWA